MSWMDWPGQLWRGVTRNPLVRSIPGRVQRSGEYLYKRAQKSVDDATDWMSELWFWLKILLAVAAGVAVVGAIVWLSR